MQKRAILIAVITMLVVTPLAIAHGVARKHGFNKPYEELSLIRKHALVHLLIRHDKWVVRTAKVHNKRTVAFHRRDLATLKKLNVSIHHQLYAATESRYVTTTRSLASSGSSYWIGKQIAAAEAIAQQASSDPWPNCADPYDGSGASWQQTVNCENNGSWYDSPGYYRCGLQFDPMWEKVYGRLCP